MRSGWLLVCLLVSDVFLTPVSPMVVMYFPFQRMARIVRSVRVMRSVLRMGMMLRRMSLTRRMLLPLLMFRRPVIGFRQLPLMTGRQDSCIKRMACEVFTKPNDKNLLQALRRADSIEERSQDFGNDGLKISFLLPPGGEDGPCHEKYRSCPFTALQLIQTLGQLKSALPPTAMKQSNVAKTLINALNPTTYPHL